MKLFEKIKNKWNWKIFAITIGMILLIVILIQIFYPKDRLLPLSRLGQQDMSFADRDKVKSTVKDQIKSQKIILASINDSSTELSGEMIASNSEIKSADLDEMFDYPLMWRFLPFSFLAHRASAGEINMDINGKIDQIADEKSANLSKEPENAVFLAKDGKIEIRPSKNGQKVSAKDARQALSAAPISLGSQTRIEIKGESMSPEITTDDYLGLKPKAEQAVARNIYFMLPVGNKIEKFATSPTERANLLGVKKADSGGYELMLKDDELAKLFGALDDKSKKTPGVTVIKTINGQEVGRVNGISGKGLDFNEFTERMNEQLFGEDKGEEILLNLKDIAPSIRFEREFTKSNAGLKAYLDETTKGKKITVSVQQLSGDFWSASAGGDARMVSASTYKLYMAQFIMNKIDNGQLSWGSSALGTNVEGCFNNMILRSANDCAENWLGVYGRNAINGYLSGLGYGEVFSNNGSAASTTANSLLKLLTNLYYGDNFSAGNADKLKKLMSSQIYRQGIPAGTKHAVANKVGFLGNVLTDAGIVYHPNGAYALVIMTEGESWGKIAEITQGIERIMYEK